MAEFLIGAQTIPAGADAVITQIPVPDRGVTVRFPNGFVRWFWLVRARLGGGKATLNGKLPLFGRGNCCCNRNESINYPVTFSGNIAIAEGGTPGEISLAITQDGSVLPESVMRATPAAVGEYVNVSAAITADVWQGCCESITVRNTSTQPILITPSALIIDPPNLDR